ncbi:MAG: tRNA pseudouridine(55) synthase TruB [Spirochaetaceae bacterium]|nr:MAG: tRNA pseudouridine(55) synthase TruB [Spirochaetaceae bacterium]
MNKNGLILIDKPASVTSFAALGRIKRALGTTKIGHTGTLDPFATGLLVVLAGSYTRLADLVTGLDKRYQAVVRFGVATDTLDCDGRQTAQCDPPTEQRLCEVIQRFVGVLQQQPPAYSALKIGGTRAYKLARSGVAVEVAARTVQVFELRLLSYQASLACIDIHCSKGTYIRSLARDIAEACGSCAHVQQLNRTSVGPFQLRHAVRVEDFDSRRDLWSADRFINTVPGVQVLTVSRTAAERVAHGTALRVRDITAGSLQAGTCALLDEDHNLLAIADYDGQGFRYRCVLRGAG